MLIWGWSAKWKTKELCPSKDGAMGCHLKSEGWSLLLYRHKGYRSHKLPSHYLDDLRMLDTRHCHPKVDSIYQVIKLGNSSHGLEAYVMANMLFKA